MLRLWKVRRNVLLVLRYGNVTPFKWHTKGFSCFYCSKPMKDCLAIREHMDAKHSAVDHSSFVPSRIISKDIPVKLDIAGIACKYCPDASMDSLEDLITHIASAHDEIYDATAGVCLLPFVLDKNLMQCVLCDVQYDNFTSMMSHMNKQHIFHTHVCQVCGLSFINIIRLNRHVKTRHVGYRCTVCDKVFSAYHKLESHKSLMHGQVKSHDCNLCSASFSNKYQVKVHMGNVHNVEKYRIKCEHCPKICTTKGAMVLHVQSQHSDLRYQCELCDYKTAIKWLIKLHQRKHFGEKNYCCGICERKFGRSANLRVHMKVHTGQIGRVCRWCRVGFTDSEELDKHRLNAHMNEGD